MVITIVIALTSISLVIISSYRSSIGLHLTCSKIYLLFLPELPKIFTHYSYFTPIAPPIIPFLFYCVNGNITMQEWLYIIYIATDCFYRIFDCSIRVSRSFRKLGGRAQAFGRVWALPGKPLAAPLFETNVSHVSAILVSDYSYFMLVHGL